VHCAVQVPWSTHLQLPDGLLFSHHDVKANDGSRRALVFGVRETQVRPRFTQDSYGLSSFLGVLQSTFEALMDQFEADDSLWVGIVESSHPKVGL
jgi:hypothetical protein